MRCPSQPITAGYTMIEMAAVISVIVVMSTILYANYHGINKKGDVLRAGEGLKNELRRAQQGSLQHKMQDGYVYGWGVQVNRLLNQYVVFADKDGDYRYSYPTKLLIHGQEYPSGSNFADSSVMERTVTVNGNALQRSNAGQPVGTSGYWFFDGSNSSLMVGAHADFNFEDQDFVIDFWLRSDPSNTGQRGLIYKWGDAAAARSWNCYKAGVTNEIVCTVVDVNDTSFVLQTAGITAGVWHHLALVRQDDMLALYLNGQQQQLVAMTTAVKSTNSPIYLGSYSDGLSAVWHGDLDEVRLAKGMYYWDGNFALPQQPHLNDNEVSKTVSLPPGIIINEITKGGVAVNSLDLYFSRIDFHLYLDGTYDSQSGMINIRDIDRELDPKVISVDISGAVHLN